MNVFLILAGLSGFSVLDSVILFKQLGGMDKISQLAAEFVTSSLKDPRLAGLVGGADPILLTPKVADQICSMLGGGCKAPLTNS
jgi:hypothetical protein